MLAWVSTEAVRTQSRELVLGRSLSKFMRALDIVSSDSGGASGIRTRLRNQMKRLFGCTVQLIYEDEHGEARVSSFIADRTEFWWNERKPDQPMLWESKIELSEKFFNEIINHPVPIDMNTLKALKRCAPGPRPVPLVGVPDIRPSYPATAHLAAGLPAVRFASGQGQR